MSKRIKIFILSFFIVVIFGLLIQKIFPKKDHSLGICRNCNVVLIDIDTLRPDSLPCYGSQRQTAPNLCSFAKKSVIFQNDYSTSYWTLPSIFSTITSLYPNFHKVQTPYVDILNPDKDTLAKTLKAKGYQTAFIGWAGNSSVITKENNGLLGYDLVNNIPVTEALSQLSKNKQPWFVHYYIEDLHIPYTLSTGSTLLEKLTPPSKFPTNIDDYNVLLNEYLKKNYQKIFRPKAIDEFSEIILSPSKVGDTNITNLFNDLISQGKIDYLYDAWMPKYNTYLETFDPKNDYDLAFLRLIYDSKVFEIDQNLKSLFEKLNSWPYSRNTIVIINSDHGEAFGKYGTLGHEGNHHTESYHVPLIIYSPSLSSKKINQTASNIDIFPTVMQMLGYDIPADLQGRNLLPYILGQESDDHRYVFSHNVDGLVIQNQKWLYFLKYDANTSDESILYDKQNDPEEKVNVAKDNPELLKLFYSKAIIYRSYGNNSLKPTIQSYVLDTLNIDSQKLERLRKEGYF